MNNLKIFENAEFGQIRTVVINEEIWFVGKDIAGALGYKEPTKAAREKVDEEDRGVSKIDTPSGIQNMTIINESGLYSLVLSSKLPSTKRFKRWITSEVIPSIRKNGGYIAGQENLTPEQVVANALIVAQNIINQKNEEIARLKPKAMFAEAVESSSSSILIGDLAKLIKQNGVDIGQKRLFVWLRENGYLIKQAGCSWNMPTQRSMQQGLFEVKESTVAHPDGHVSIHRTTKVTGKGQIYFVHKFLKMTEDFKIAYF